MVSAHCAIRFGVRFNPSPEEAISLYLRRWAAGQPLPDTAGIVHEADVYKFDPKDLAAAFPRLPKTENRFFFTACKRQKAGRGYRMSRAAGDGNWVSSEKKKIKNSAGKTIGYHEKLRYTYKDKSRESEWLMDEYHLDELAALGGDQERVLCRVYPRPGSVTLQQSAAAGDLGLGVQEPAGSTMAVAAVQPRRQEPVAPVLRTITQPQAIKKPALQPRVVTVPTPVAITPQAPKRAAPQVAHAEPQRPKRMRIAAALPPLEVPVPPPGSRHDVVGWNTPKQPSWNHAPTATRESSGSPVADPPRPAAEAPTNEMDVDAELEMAPVEEDHGIMQEEAGDDEIDEFARLLEREIEEVPHTEHDKIQDEEEVQLEMAPVLEDQGIMQEESGHGEEEHAKIQDEEEGQHQHAGSLEGFVVDERADDVVAQDFFDEIEEMADPIDGEHPYDWSIPLSEYNIPLW